eukprot:11099619-Lingulodinium_polyedra.AAC.1
MRFCCLALAQRSVRIGARVCIPDARDSREPAAESSVKSMLRSRSSAIRCRGRGAWASVCYFHVLHASVRSRRVELVLFQGIGVRPIIVV